MRTTTERRRHAREPIARPCKVFQRATQKYAAARTKDISAGGALLDVHAARPILIGEAVDVAVSWSRSAVLPEGALVEGKVVRVQNLGDHRQILAVEFARPAEIAAVA